MKEAKAGKSVSLKRHGRRRSTIGILSLGCPRNLVDSEGILGRLSLKGYSVGEMEGADVAIVNTCSFIEEARRESIEAILDLVELKREGRIKKILVYGCLPERYKDILAGELPEIDAFVGKVSLNHDSKRFPITPSHYAYLKICEGCLSKCSFCVIPKIKGRFTSLTMEAALKRIERFSQDGLSELNIIGQDITGYGLDIYGKPKLAELLKRIAKQAKGIRWLRLLYLNPCRLTDELLEVIRDEPKVCKYIDLPVQHINERILGLMNRNTTKAGILKTLKKIRKIIPDAALRTSIIVGFPSETEREFKELLDFIKDARFEKLGAFIYSREEGTPAYAMKGQIPHKIKSERFDMIMSAQRDISGDKIRRLLGKVVDVLIDEKEDEHFLGRTQNDAPEVDGLVYVKSGRKLNPGDIVKVKITDTLEYDLAGEEVCSK